MQKAARLALVASVGLVLGASAARAQEPGAACAGRTDVLGVTRTVEIDTVDGPQFGRLPRPVDFLRDGEVVLTFDDGPIRRYTLPVLDALDAHCTKGTFFIVGRMAMADPATLKEMRARGHTIATHTYSHRNLTGLGKTASIAEIERGISATSAALGAPVAPFFRFPYLAVTRGAMQHLASRHVATVGIDIDSHDFLLRSPLALRRLILSKLKAQRKGIILMHDIQFATAAGLKDLLEDLRLNKFKVVHMTAKVPADTVASFDAEAHRLLERRSARLAARKARTAAAGMQVAAPLAPRVVLRPAAMRRPVVDRAWMPKALLHKPVGGLGVKRAP